MVSQHAARKMVLLGVTLSISLRASSQASVTVPAGLEQSSQITSRGKQVTPGNGTGPIALPDDFDTLRLAPGYILSMSVFNAPEMSETLRVDDQGMIFPPLAGLIHAEGLTLRGAEQAIADRLVATQMMVAPQVSLQLTSYTTHSVMVSGEVQTPGKIQILSRRPLLDIIAAAGGVTTAAGGDIQIVHPVAGQPDSVRHIPFANGRDPMAAQTTMVYPGDEVFVRRAGVIYVLGAVFHPGGYLMVNGGTLNLTEAVSLASGTTPVASPPRTVVVRRNGDQVTQLKVALDKVQRGEQQPFHLQDGDIVYVPSSKLKSAFINSSNILSSAASAGIFVASGH